MSKQTPNHQEPQVSTATVAKAEVSLQEVTASTECGYTDVKLTLGLYEMSERNTPGVGGVLEAAEIDAIPEAYCYLTYEGRRFDFTGLAPGCASPFDTLIEERTVSPSEVISVKAAFHGDALAKWARSRHVDLEHAWKIREECIRWLANTTPPGKNA